MTNDSRDSSSGAFDGCRDHRLRVVINLLGLPHLRQGGAGIYAGELIAGLAARPEIDVAVLAEMAAAEDLPDLGEGSEIWAVDNANASRARRAFRLASSTVDPRRYTDLKSLEVDVDTWRPDVVHYPLSFMSAPQHRAVSVVTAVDLQHLELPEFFSRRDRLLRQARWHRSLRVADRVIALSQATKRSLVDRLSLDPNLIDVVFLSGTRLPTGPPSPAIERIPTPFIVYPASPLPAKNHLRLLAAFERVTIEDDAVRLVLTGPALHDWASVASATSKMRSRDRVVFAGHVSPASLRWLYQQADGLIFASLFEGFGLPIVEAMSLGCPVAAGNAWSVPEIVPDGTPLFDPTRVDEIAAAIMSLRQLSPQARARASRRGREAAAAFSPERLVSETIAAYRMALTTTRRTQSRETHP